jgi:hypothetical protein
MSAKTFVPAAVGKLFSEQMETFHSGGTMAGTTDLALALTCNQHDAHDITSFVTDEKKTVKVPVFESTF